jgi:hypothetical protein
MKCYYDPTQDAVGTCKGCGKGLSADFATDLGKGLACKGRCEAHVQGLIKAEENAIATTETTRTLLKGSGKAAYGSCAFFFCLGLLFLLFGFVYGFDVLNLGMGLLGIGYSAFVFIRAKGIDRSLQRASTSRANLGHAREPA